tara:strand:+ start:500 stop:667 length:168 start_codon:yes stop_codon:yes gene_type:complete
MLNPASPIYEVLIGTTLLVIVLGLTFSIPAIFALYQDAKEQSLRSNKSSDNADDQ